MTKPALALAAALALATGGCTGSSSTHSSGNGFLTASGPAEGRVVGTLKMVGGLAPGSRPQAHLVFRVLLGSSVVQRVMTDRRGRFTFLLTPGTYTLTMGPNTPIHPTTLRVVAAQITHLPLRIEAK
jgi:hypothetical protein